MKALGVALKVPAGLSRLAPIPQIVQDASLFVFGAAYLVLSSSGFAPSEYGVIGALSIVAGIFNRVQALKPFARYLKATISSLYFISFLLLGYASLYVHGFTLQGVALVTFFALFLLYAAILLYSSLRT